MPVQAVTTAYEEIGFSKHSLDDSNAMVTYQREADGYEMFHHIPEKVIDFEFLIRDIMVALDDDDLVTRFVNELVLAVMHPPNDQLVDTN